MAKLNKRYVIEYPDGEKEYLSLYTTLEEVNGMGKAFKIPNIGTVYYGIGEVTDPQASKHKRFNMNGAVMAGLKEVTTRYYSKYFFCDTGENDIILPPDAISVEYTLFGAGSGLAIFDNLIHTGDDPKMSANDYNEFAKLNSTIYPNGVNGGSILSGSATKLSLVNSDGSVKPVAEASGGILEIYAPNINDNSTKATANNLLSNHDDATKVSEFSYRKASDYSIGIVNKLIGREVPYNNSFATDQNKETPIEKFKEYNNLLKNSLNTQLDLEYYIPIHVNKDAYIYNKIGPCISEISTDLILDENQKSIIDNLDVNIAKIYKDAINSGYLIPGYVQDKLKTGSIIDADQYIPYICQLPKVFNKEYQEPYTYSEIGVNTSDSNSYYNKFISTNNTKSTINNKPYSTHKDNSLMASYIKARAKLGLNSGRYNEFINDFYTYDNILYNRNSDPVIGRKNIKFPYYQISNNFNKYFIPETGNCDFNVGGNLHLDYTFYFRQFKNYMKETGDKYDLTDPVVYSKFNPYMAGCISGSKAKVVHSVVNVIGCKAIRISVGEHGKMYSNKLGLEINNYFKDIEANGFAIIKINFRDNSEYTATDELFYNSIKSWLSIDGLKNSTTKVPYYDTISNNRLNNRETLSEYRNIRPIYTTGGFTFNLESGGNQTDQVYLDISEDPIASPYISSSYYNEYKLDYDNKYIYQVISTGGALYNNARISPLFLKDTVINGGYDSNSGKNDAQRVENEFIRLMASDKFDTIKEIKYVSSTKDFKSKNYIKTPEYTYIDMGKQNTKPITEYTTNSPELYIDFSKLKYINMSKLSCGSKMHFLVNHESDITNIAQCVNKDADLIVDENNPNTMINNYLYSNYSFTRAFINASSITDLSQHEFKYRKTNLDMNQVFAGCTNLRKLPKNFIKLITEHTTTANYFSSLFYGCKSLEDDISEIDFTKHTSKILDMALMYYNSNCKKINPNINYSSLYKANAMYNGCTLDGSVPEKFVFTDKMESIFRDAVFVNENICKELISLYEKWNNSQTSYNEYEFKSFFDRSTMVGPVNMKVKYNHHGVFQTNGPVDIEYTEPLPSTLAPERYTGFKNYTCGYNLKHIQSKKFINAISKISRIDLPDDDSTNIYNIKLSNLPNLSGGGVVSLIASEKFTNKFFNDNAGLIIIGLNGEFTNMSDSDPSSIISTITQVYGARSSYVYNPNTHSRKSDGLTIKTSDDGVSIFTNPDKKCTLKIYKDARGKSYEALPSSTAELVKSIDIESNMQLKILSEKSFEINGETVNLNLGSNNIAKIAFEDNYSAGIYLKYNTINDGNYVFDALDEHGNINAMPAVNNIIDIRIGENYADPQLWSEPRDIEIAPSICNLTFTMPEWMTQNNSIDMIKYFLKYVNDRRSAKVLCTINVKNSNNTTTTLKL